MSANQGSGRIALSELFMAKTFCNPKTGCWEWTGAAVRTTGYGFMHVDGKHISAHRLAVLLFSSEQLRPKQIVRHQCNNRACVNPAHLQLGTHMDNMRDMALAGRTRARLSAHHVQELRTLRARGELLVNLAAQFGISAATASQIATGATYKHIPGPLTKTRFFPSRSLRDDDARRKYIKNRIAVDERNDCWVWQGPTTPSGYGRYGNEVAHRVSFRLFKGLIPSGMHVHHVCRNRKCVNPEHLVTTTPQENLAHRLLRRGERHQGAKLSDSQVLEIRERFVLRHESGAALGREFGVEAHAITSLVPGIRRLEAGGPTIQHTLPKWNLRRLSDEDAREIRTQYASGQASMGGLAKQFKTTVTAIKGILDGKTYFWADGPFVPQSERKWLRLPKETVREMRHRANASPLVTLERIAAEYKLCMTTVIRILRHDTYKEAGGPRVVRSAVRRGRPNVQLRRLSTSDVRTIRDAYATGCHSMEALGKRYGISRKAVAALLARKTYRSE